MGSIEGGAASANEKASSGHAQWTSRASAAGARTTLCAASGAALAGGRGQGRAKSFRTSPLQGAPRPCAWNYQDSHREAPPGRGAESDAPHDRERCQEVWGAQLEGGRVVVHGPHWSDPCACDLDDERGLAGDAGGSAGERVADLQHIRRPLRHWIGRAMFCDVSGVSVRQWLGLRSHVIAESTASASSARTVALSTWAYHRLRALWTTAGCKRHSSDRDAWAQAGPLIVQELPNLVRDAAGRSHPAAAPREAVARLVVGRNVSYTFLKRSGAHKREGPRSLRTGGTQADGAKHETQHRATRRHRRGALGARRGRSTRCPHRATSYARVMRSAWRSTAV